MTAVKHIRNTTFVLLTLTLIIFVLGLYPKVVENYYSELIYPLISMVQRCIASFFPFAIGDLLYTLLIIYVIKEIVTFLSKTKKDKDAYLFFALRGFNFLLIIYISFKVLWGLNYSRPQINEQLQISKKPYQKEQLLQLSSLFIDKLEKLGKAIGDTTANYTIAELQDHAAVSYNTLAVRQPLFEYKYDAVKPVVSGWLTSKLGIEGYYNPLSGEANINTKLPKFVLPFVVCHEMAHQVGVAREDEANLVGYLVAIHSEDIQFQYAAYYNMLRYLLFEIRMKYPEDYNTLITQIPQQVMDNFKKEREFWAKYNGSMSVYMGKTFDKILKLNNQQKGINSYQDIVLWLVNYHEKELEVLN